MDETLSADDLIRRRQLRAMKGIATAALLLAAVLYALTLHSTREDPDGWLGYVNAASEAAMVGAIADWFAVTALFRRPLGLPIPHTGIIPRKKDQLARSLRGFIVEHFLHGDVIRERLLAAEPSRRAGEWLSEDANMERVVAGVSTMVEGAMSRVSERTLIDRLKLRIGAVVLGWVSTEAQGFARRLVADPELQAKTDAMIADASVSLVERHGEDVTGVITDTIERWDGKQAARRIELYVGRDLQYIRLNGTVVGALVGLAIHALSQVFGG